MDCRRHHIVRKQQLSCQVLFHNQLRAGRMGRTSIAPSRTLGICAAMAIASSRSCASIKKKPANCSAVSATGPEVFKVLPLLTSTVLPVQDPRMPHSTAKSRFQPTDILRTYRIGKENAPSSPPIQKIRRRIRAFRHLQAVARQQLLFCFISSRRHRPFLHQFDLRCVAD